MICGGNTIYQIPGKGYMSRDELTGWFVRHAGVVIFYGVSSFANVLANSTYPPLFVSPLLP